MAVTSTYVSVIVPARDAEPTLDRLIEALREQDCDVSFEVVVVDDGSRDATRVLAGRHAPFVRLVPLPESRGPGAARNAGVAVAKGEVLAFTDADCVPTRRWLARGLAALSGTDMVQGRVAPDPTAQRTPFDRTLQVENDGGFYQTANLFVRRHTFAEVGGFRDWALSGRHRDRKWAPDRRRGRIAQTPIGEDTLFAWEARRLGASSRFAGDALVHHEVVPGGVRHELRDRWHWSRDMPGLVARVPELRDGVFFKRWFFNHWTAQFDLAFVSVALAAGMRRRLWLFGCLPYGWRLALESRRYSRRHILKFLLGAPICEGATLVAFVVGGVEWRTLVL
jgi:glycosyltransferase involved in cell wall biosynthesis